MLSLIHICYYKADYVKNYDIKNQKYIQKIIEELSKKLQIYAVWNDKHTEVSWFTVQMFSFGKLTWDIQPMNMYLYCLLYTSRCV